MLGIWNHPETGTDPDIRKPAMAPQADPRWTHAITWVQGVTDESVNLRAGHDPRSVDQNAALGPGRIPWTTPSVQENRLGICRTPLGANWGFVFSLRNITPYPRRASIPVQQQPHLQYNHGPGTAPTPIHEPSYLAPEYTAGM